MKKLFIKKLLINYFLLNGKKHVSEKLLIKITKLIQKNILKKSFETIIKIALINSSPHIYLKTLKKKKKMSLEVPFLIKKELKLYYGVKYILQVRDVKRVPYQSCVKLYLELVSISKLEGSNTKKTDEIYKKSFLNKKFTNYRWFN